MKKFGYDYLVIGKGVIWHFMVNDHLHFGGIMSEKRIKQEILNGRLELMGIAKDKGFWIRKPQNNCKETASLNRILIDKFESLKVVESE